MSVVLLVGIILILVFAVFVYLYILRKTNNDPGIGDGGFKSFPRIPDPDVKESDPPSSAMFDDVLYMDDQYIPKTYSPARQVFDVSPESYQYNDSEEFDSQEILNWSSSVDRSPSASVLHSQSSSVSRNDIDSPEAIHYPSPVRIPSPIQSPQRRPEDESQELVAQNESQGVYDNLEPLLYESPRKEESKSWTDYFLKLVGLRSQTPARITFEPSQSTNIESQQPIPAELDPLSEQLTYASRPVVLPRAIWNEKYLRDLQGGSWSQERFQDQTVDEEEPYLITYQQNTPSPVIQNVYEEQIENVHQEQTQVENIYQPVPSQEFLFSPPDVYVQEYQRTETETTPFMFDAMTTAWSPPRERVIGKPPKSFVYKPGAQSARRNQNRNVISQTPKSARRSRPSDESVDVSHWIPYNDKVLDLSDWMPYSDALDLSNRTVNNDKVLDLFKLNAYQPNVTQDLSEQFENLHLSPTSVSSDRGSQDLVTPFQELKLSPKSQSGSSELQGLSDQFENLHFNPKSVSSYRGSPGLVTPFQELKLSPKSQSGSFELQDVVTPFQELKWSPSKSKQVSSPTQKIADLSKELSQPMTRDETQYPRRLQNIARNPSLQHNDISPNVNERDPNLPPTSNYVQARFPIGLVYGQSLVKNSSPRVQYGPPNQPFVSPSPPTVTSTLSPQTPPNSSPRVQYGPPNQPFVSPSPPTVTSTLSPQSPTPFGPQNQRTRMSPKFTPSSSRLTKSMTPRAQPISSTAQTPSVIQPPSTLSTSIEPSVTSMQSPVKPQSTYLGKRIGPEQSYDPMKFPNVYQEQYPSIQEQFNPSIQRPHEPVMFTSPHQSPNVSGQRFPSRGARVLLDIPPVLEANTYVPVTPFTGTPMQPSSMPTVQQEYRKPAYDLGDKMAMQYWLNQANQSNTVPLSSDQMSQTAATLPITEQKSFALVPSRSSSSPFKPSANKRALPTFTIDQDVLDQLSNAWSGKRSKQYSVVRQKQYRPQTQYNVMTPEDERKHKMQKSNRLVGSDHENTEDEFIAVSFGEGPVIENIFLKEERSPTKQQQQADIIFDKLKMKNARITLVTTPRYAEHLRRLMENRLSEGPETFESVYNDDYLDSSIQEVQEIKEPFVIPTPTKQKSVRRRRRQQTDESKHLPLNNDSNDSIPPEWNFIPWPTSRVHYQVSNTRQNISDRFIGNRKPQEKSSALVAYGPQQETVEKRRRPKDEIKEYVQRDEARDEDDHVDKSAVIFDTDEGEQEIQEIKPIEVPRVISYVDELHPQEQIVETPEKFKNVAMDQRMINVSTQGIKRPLHKTSSQPAVKPIGTWGERKALRKQWFNEKQKPLESDNEHQAIEQVEDVSSIKQTVVGNSSVSEVEEVEETEPTIHRDEVTQNNPEEQNTEMDEYMTGNKGQRPKRPLPDAVVPQRGKFPNARQTPSTNVRKTSKNIQRGKKNKQLEAKNNQTQARQVTNITLPANQPPPEVIQSPQVWNEQKLHQVAVLSTQPSVTYVQPTEKLVDEKDEPHVQTILGKRVQTPDKTTKTKKSREDYSGTVSSKPVSKRKNPSSQVSEHEESSSNEEKPTIHNVVWDSQALAEIANEEKGIHVKNTSPFNRQLVSSPSLSVSPSPTKQPLPDEESPDYEDVVNRSLGGTSLMGAVVSTGIGAMGLTKSQSTSLSSSQEMSTHKPTSASQESKLSSSQSSQRSTTPFISSQPETKHAEVVLIPAVTNLGALIGGESPESEPETYLRTVHPYAPPPSKSRESRLKKSNKLKGVQPRDYSPTITLPTIPQDITLPSTVSQGVEQVVSKPLFVKQQNRNPKQTDKEIRLQKARARKLPPPTEPTESESKLSNVTQSSPTIVRSSPSPSSVSDSSSESSSSSVRSARRSPKSQPLPPDSPDLDIVSQRDKPKEIIGLTNEDDEDILLSSSSESISPVSVLPTPFIQKVQKNKQKVDSAFKGHKYLSSLEKALGVTDQTKQTRNALFESKRQIAEQNTGNPTQGESAIASHTQLRIERQPSWENSPDRESEGDEADEEQAEFGANDYVYAELPAEVVHASLTRSPKTIPKQEVSAVVIRSSPSPSVSQPKSSSPGESEQKGDYVIINGKKIYHTPQKPIERSAEQRVTEETVEIAGNQIPIRPSSTSGKDRSSTPQRDSSDRKRPGRKQNSPSTDNSDIQQKPTPEVRPTRPKQNREEIPVRTPSPSLAQEEEPGAKRHAVDNAMDATLLPSTMFTPPFEVTDTSIPSTYEERLIIRGPARISPSAENDAPPPLIRQTAEQAYLANIQANQASSVPLPAEDEVLDDAMHERKHELIAIMKSHSAKHTKPKRLERAIKSAERTGTSSSPPEPLSSAMRAQIEKIKYSKPKSVETKTPSLRNIPVYSAEELMKITADDPENETPVVSPPLQQVALDVIKPTVKTSSPPTKKRSSKQKSPSSQSSTSTSTTKQSESPNRKQPRERPDDSLPKGSGTKEENHPRDESSKAIGKEIHRKPDEIAIPTGKRRASPEVKTASQKPNERTSVNVKRNIGKADEEPKHEKDKSVHVRPRDEDSSDAIQPTEKIIRTGTNVTYKDKGGDQTRNEPGKKPKAEQSTSHEQMEEERMKQARKLEQEASNGKRVITELPNRPVVHNAPYTTPPEVEDKMPDNYNSGSADLEEQKQVDRANKKQSIPPVVLTPEQIMEQERQKQEDEESDARNREYRELLLQPEEPAPSRGPSTKTLIASGLIPDPLVMLGDNRHIVNQMRDDLLMLEEKKSQPRLSPSRNVSPPKGVSSQERKKEENEEMERMRQQIFEGRNDPSKVYSKASTQQGDLITTNMSSHPLNSGVVSKPITHSPRIQHTLNESPQGDAESDIVLQETLQQPIPDTMYPANVQPLNEFDLTMPKGDLKVTLPPSPERTTVRTKRKPRKDELQLLEETKALGNKMDDSLDSNRLRRAKLNEYLKTTKMPPGLSRIEQKKWKQDREREARQIARSTVNNIKDIKKQSNFKRAQRLARRQD